jgi:two-component system invasion response regulator UvrY
MPVTIAVVDDHLLFRKGLINIVEALGADYQVKLEAENGIDMLHKLKENEVPNVVLLDVEMPEMNGFDTAAYLKAHYPGLYVLVITMEDTESTLLRMIQLGVKGFLSKNVEVDQLRMAIDQVSQGKFFYTEELAEKLVRSVSSKEPPVKVDLTDSELELIRRSCSEYTYKEIADMMNLSPKTVENYRASLFEKLKVKTRVGLVMYAIKTGLVNL